MCNGGLDIGDLVVEQNETDDEEERRIARYWPHQEEVSPY